MGNLYTFDKGLLNYRGNNGLDSDTVSLPNVVADSISTPNFPNGINAPTGRTATYVIAASDAPANVKAQADYVCDGTADEVEINAAINALPAGQAAPVIAGGGRIYLTEGIFHISSPIWITRMCVELSGAGQGWSASGFNDVWSWGTTKITTDANAIDGIWIGDNTASGYRGIKITNLTVSGSGYTNGRFAIGTPTISLGKVDSPIISDVSFMHFQTGISMCSDTAYIDRCQLLALTDGINFHTSFGGGFGFPLNSVDQCMMGDISGIGVQGASRVVNCGFWGADSAHQMTIGAFDCELVVGCHFGGGDGAEPIKGTKNCRNVTGNVFDNCITGIEYLGSSAPSAVSGNVVKDSHTLGIELYTSTGITVTGNSISGTVSYQGIGCSQLLNTLIEGNHFISNTSYPVYLGTNCISVTITGNTFESNGGNNGVGTDGTDTFTRISNNTGWIASGEIRTVSGSISTLTQNAYNSLDNPFGQSVAMLRLDIYVSTKATTGSPNLDSGIGSSATTDYTTLFDDLPCETVGFYTSTVTTPGAQTVPQLWESGSGNRYLNMSIKDAAATGMVATYTVTVMGN
jgi:parallel beta-helix repeat protein